MTEMQRLLTWMSPAFPVGSFAWSSGLEAAIVGGRVTDRATTQDWIAGALRHGSLRTDAILLTHAYRHNADAAVLRDLAELALALNPALERYAETTQVGNAFAAAAGAWPLDQMPPVPSPCPYPIAVGAFAGAHRLGLPETISAWLTAAVHAQVSVAVRLVPIGQNDGLRIVASLEQSIAERAEDCARASLDDIGGVAYGADIAQMQHETLQTRIFRS